MIRVYTDAGVHDYPAANGYVVDATGNLHIPGGKERGNLAGYNADTWIRVTNES